MDNRTNEELDMMLDNFIRYCSHWSELTFVELWAGIEQAKGNRLKSGVLKRVANNMIIRRCPFLKHQRSIAHGF